MATLDGGKYGLTFAAGMGAISTVTQLLSAGDHIICCNNVYSGVPYYYDKIAVRLGITIDMVDVVDLNEIHKAVKPNTKVGSQSGEELSYYPLLLVPCSTDNSYYAVIHR